MFQCKKCLLSWNKLPVREEERDGHCGQYTRAPQGPCKYKIYERRSIEVTDVVAKRLIIISREGMKKWE